MTAAHTSLILAVVLMACPAQAPSGSPAAAAATVCQCAAEALVEHEARLAKQRRTSAVVLSTGLSIGIHSVDRKLSLLLELLRDSRELGGRALHEACRLIGPMASWLKRGVVAPKVDEPERLAEARRLCKDSVEEPVEADTCSCGPVASRARLVAQMEFEQQLSRALIHTSIRAGDFANRATRRLEQNDTLPPKMVSELLSVLREVRLGAVTTLPGRSEPLLPACSPTICSIGL